MGKLLTTSLLAALLLQPGTGRVQSQPVASFFLTLHLAGGTGLVALGGGTGCAHQWWNG